ncbi:hypothetical protein D9M72_634550 [compost metagenome]
MHALIILVGCEDAGHLGAVTDPIKSADLILDMVKTRITEPSSKRRQAAVQTRIDQCDSYTLAGAAAGIKT